MFSVSVRTLLILLLNCCVLSVNCAKLKDLPSELSTKVLANNTEATEDTQSLRQNELGLKRVQSREATYSYFYVGRWLWHIPLWFLLYFTLYVLGNVFRSIYGHTVSISDLWTFIVTLELFAFAPTRPDLISHFTQIHTDYDPRQLSI